MTKAFWRGFWEGMNPLWALAWLLYGMGHCVSLVMHRWDAMGRLYPVYNKLMGASSDIQDRFGLSGPWEKWPDGQTMAQRYGDGSDHLACRDCGLCRSCGDCKCAKTACIP